MSAHHHHHHTHGGKQPSLLLPLLLIAGFAAVEAIGGWWTGSLALLSDAGHMVSDALALALAWIGSWIASKPATRKHNFGLGRAEVIVALLNALLMLAVIAYIVYEAVQRLMQPQPVQGGEVMLIAFVGLVVNIIVAWMLHTEHSSLNSRAALLHVMGDLLGSVAAIVAGAVIYFTGWTPVDPLLSLFISVLILMTTLRLLGEVLHVLMEAVPHHINIQDVEQAMSRVEKVHGVHYLHIWSLSSERTALSAHIVLADMQDWQEVLSNLGRMLEEQFNIEHVTLQPEIHIDSSEGYADCWLTQHTDHPDEHDHDHCHGHGHAH